MEELDARKETILRAVVIEYVSTAEPVGSETLAAKYPFGVRSATVRSVLSELAERGLLEQPHTSAGRIPSDRGYRYYVDRLGERAEIAEGAKTAVHGATAPNEALAETLRETLRALARLTRGLALAATVRAGEVQVRAAVVSALGPNQALLVLALADGRVENRLIACPAHLTLEEVGVANASLAGAVVGKTLAGLARLKIGAEGGTAGERILAVAGAELRKLARDLTRGRVFAEGEPYVFAQPEFRAAPDELARVIEEMTEGDLFYGSFERDGLLKDGTVTIGRENDRAELHRFSVVRRTFSVGGADAGVLAVVGPTRMDYDASAALLDFTANALSQSLTRYFG